MSRKSTPSKGAEDNPILTRIGLTFRSEEGTACVPLERLLSSISDWMGDSGAGSSINRRFAAILSKILERERGSLNETG